MERKPVSYTHLEVIERYAAQIRTADVIEIADIPTIDLYMDQVTTFMDKGLARYKRNETDKILTKTMINNYTKAKIFPPPVKKKYSRTHLMLLIMIYHLKACLLYTSTCSSTCSRMNWRD